jgi:four helix bundle protein
MRRAAISVPANIAEGSGRSSEGELGRYMTIAMGSASELEYLVMLSGDLGFLQGEASGGLLESTREVKRMLAGFLRALGR